MYGLIYQVTLGQISLSSVMYIFNYFLKKLCISKYMKSPWDICDSLFCFVCVLIYVFLNKLYRVTWMSRCPVRFEIFNYSFYNLCFYKYTK